MVASVLRDGTGRQCQFLIRLEISLKERRTLFSVLLHDKYNLQSIHYIYNDEMGGRKSLAVNCSSTLSILLMPVLSRACLNVQQVKSFCLRFTCDCSNTGYTGSICSRGEYVAHQARSDLYRWICPSVHMLYRNFMHFCTLS